MTLEELEREHIRRVLTSVQGDKVRAAEALGIHLSTLYRKVQRYRLENVGLSSRRGAIGGAARRAAGRDNWAVLVYGLVPWACSALKPLVAIGIGTR